MNTCEECRFFDLCRKAGEATDDLEACNCFEPNGRLMYTIEDSKHGARTLYYTVVCESCKHYNNGFCENIDGLTGAVKKEDYCSRGEKK